MIRLCRDFFCVDEVVSVGSMTVAERSARPLLCISLSVSLSASLSLSLCVSSSLCLHALLYLLRSSGEATNTDCFPKTLCDLIMAALCNRGHYIFAL